MSSREEGGSFPLGPSDSVSMSPSTQLAAALAEEFGVRKAVLGGLKEHQSNTGKGKRSEWGPNHSSVPEASAEVGVERITPGKPKSSLEGSWSKEAIMARGDCGMASLWVSLW